GPVVHHDHGQAVQPGRAGVRDRLVVAALVQFGVADQDVDVRGQQSLRAQSERDADAERQPVPQRAGADLHTGYQQPVRVVTEAAVRPGHVVEPVGGEVPLGGEYRIEGGRSVPLGQHEPVAVRVVDPV